MKLVALFSAGAASAIVPRLIAGGIDASASTNATPVAKDGVVTGMPDPQQDTKFLVSAGVADALRGTRDDLVRLPQDHPQDGSPITWDILLPV